MVRIPRLLQQRVVDHLGLPVVPLRRARGAQVVQATVLGQRAMYSRGVVSSIQGPLLFARPQLGLLRVVAEDKGVVLLAPVRDFVESFPIVVICFPLPCI